MLMSVDTEKNAVTVTLRKKGEPDETRTYVLAKDATIQIDGKAGMLTRAALGAYQKKNGLKVDCWPTADVLANMRR